ncbi:MAG TPA: hypothetical protein PLE24_12985 [Chitinispirillaceae bacterium]|nr:hypothetical protein [Chitinispirillaceae bacterium]
MKTLVVYYSKSGNNKYLARKCIEALGGDIEEITPRMSAFFFQVLSSLTGAGLGINPLKADLKEYDRVLLCGPVWMGNLIYPLRSFIKEYNRSINNLIFATCCGVDDSEKDSRFGYTRVFSKVRSMAGEKSILCEAFPIKLVVPEEQRHDNDALMKARLSDDTFKGEILQRFDNFIKRVKTEV